jgi:tetratricopeptide (TPR) repeat protein
MQRPRSKDSPAAVSKSPAKRLWLFRLMALVLMPLLFLLLVELALRLAGFGYPTAFFLTRQIRGKDCLIQNDQFGWRFFGAEKARSPCPFVLPKAKLPGTVRIFVFGESAAFGDPQPEFGLPRMLEALLTLRYPNTHFEVVNTAMTGINSHVILPIARDCASEQGDVWVIYMGNNEVVGPFGSGTVFGPQAPGIALVRLGVALKATRIGELIATLIEKLRQRPASERIWGGMEMFLQNHVRQDDPRMANVYASFQRNLSDIISTGLRSGAKVVVSAVARNLRDCAPFASEHRSNLSVADLAGWEDLYQRAIEDQQGGRPAQAIAHSRQAAAVDPSFAELHFRWGQCSLALSNQPEAAREFALAADLDALRFRSDSRINDAIRHAAAGREQEGIQFADAQEILAAQSPQGLVGDEFLYEHVHLNFEGNYLLARRLAGVIAQCIPQKLGGGASSNQSWPSETDCARRLSFTDFNRREAEIEILQRLINPPYTTQPNHAEEYGKFSRHLEELLPATRPEALEGDKTICRQSLAAWPEDWMLWQNLALFQQQTGDNAGRVESFRRVVELLPQNREAWRSLGIALRALGRDEEALTAFQQAFRLNPADAAALEGQAEVMLSQGKTAEAGRLFRRVLKIQPNFGPAHLGLGKILDAAGRRELAKEEYRQAMQTGVNTPAAFAGMAKFFYDKGDYANAATNFLHSLRLNPSDPDIHVSLGMALTQLRRYDEAQAHYAEAVRLDPNFAGAHFCLGMAKGRLHDDAGALAEFAEAVRLKPDLLVARLNLGIALFNQHRNEDAARQFEAVLHGDSTNQIALSYLRLLQGRQPAGPAQ